MLKKFVLRNYKNFKKDIIINFGNVGGYQFNPECITNGLISKMIIYGRNATGKTNLGLGLLDISRSLMGMPFRNDGVYLNADSEEPCAGFSYTFLFDGQELLYEYKKSSEIKLCEEKLFINGEKIFSIDFETKQYDFANLKLIEAETVIPERYIQYLSEIESFGAIDEVVIPFLRWLINNTAFKGGSVLMRLNDYIKRMMIVTVSGPTTFRTRNMEENFAEFLDKDDNLKNFEEFLNIMGIECKLLIKILPDGHKQLYFNHKKPVLFYDTASSGTLALVSLYRRFIVAGKTASFMYFDEFDAFYHYEMAENVIRFFKKKYPACQIILTTHNTNLMTNRLMRPDCLQILSRKGELTALCNATQRELREGHNLEKMYISGEFDRYE